MKYDEEANTLNQYGIPASQVVKATRTTDEAVAPDEARGEDAKVSTDSHE
ncbi:MAG: hypothetical protein HC892_17800 [Saprospiraceae bacterium]|nr:hypothetical protein [Saprospiraceae bacterium]